MHYCYWDKLNILKINNNNYIYWKLKISVNFVLFFKGKITIVLEHKRRQEEVKKI